MFLYRVLHQEFELCALPTVPEASRVLLIFQLQNVLLTKNYFQRKLKETKIIKIFFLENYEKPQRKTFFFIYCHNVISGKLKKMELSFYFI